MQNEGFDQGLGQEMHELGREADRSHSQPHCQHPHCAVNEACEHGHTHRLLNSPSPFPARPIHKVGIFKFEGSTQADSYFEGRRPAAPSPPARPRAPGRATVCFVALSVLGQVGVPREKRICTQKRRLSEREHRFQKRKV